MEDNQVYWYRDHQKTILSDIPFGAGISSLREQAFSRSRISSTNCPYCDLPLRRDYQEDLTSFDWNRLDMDLGCSDGLFQTLVRCKCGWWLYHYKDGSDGKYGEWANEAILKKFSIDSIALPIEALNYHITSRFADLRHVTPRKLEEWVAGLIRDHLDCEVRLTSATRDGGVDVYALLGEQKMAIQVKRRSRGGAEPVAAIREFVGVLFTGGIPQGLFVTTADHFSASAREVAVTACSRGFRLDLVDFHDLEDLFRLTWRKAASRGEQYWQDLAAKSQRSSYKLGAGF